MRLFHRFRGAVLALVRQRHVERELDAELKEFFAASVEQKLAAGMSVADAERAARLELGSPAAVKEWVRDAGWESRVDTVWQDVKYAVRIFWRSPGFAFAAITTFALGIGANTAIFSLVDAAVLRPLPYDDPGRLFTINIQNAEGRLRENTIPRDFLDWRERSDLFEGIATTGGGAFNLAGSGEPERLRVIRASAGFFELYRTTPHLGRFFTRDDEAPGHHRVVILSHAFWRNRFGARSDIVSSTVRLNGEPYDVIGVAREDFVYPPNSALGAPVFLPVIFTEKDRAYGVVQSMATGVDVRLRPDVSAAQAEAAISQMLAAADERKLAFNKGYRSARLTPMLDGYVGDSRSWMLMLLGAVSLVLLIACANVANLILAHGATRVRELTVRSAIGASRGRIARQLLAESLVLALIGGAAGVLVAWGGLALLRSALPASIPRSFSVALDGRVLAFTTLVAVATGFLCGLLPAFQSSRVDLIGGLKESTGHGSTAGAGSSRIRKALAWAEVALAVMLLVGAGLLISSFARLMRVDHGFDASGVTLAGFSVPRTADRQASAQLVLRMLEAVRAVPGVQADVISGGSGPYEGGWSAFPLRIVGQPPAPGKDIRFSHVSDGFFEILRVPVRRGRGLMSADEDGPPVAVINEAAVREFWAGRNPIGDRLEIEKNVYEIVGIVADMRYTGPASAPVPQAFLPVSKRGSNGGTLIFRSSAPLESVLPAIKRAVWSVLPGEPVTEVLPSEAVFTRSTATRRFNLLLMSIFATLALVIAATGIYGVISFVVTQRTREIGVRMALGANPRAVVRLFVGQGAAIVLLGVIAGLAGAWWLAETLRSYLFEVQPRDPAVFAFVAVCLAAIGLLACWLPARRAARVDPLVALRAE